MDEYSGFRETQCDAFGRFVMHRGVLTNGAFETSYTYVQIGQGVCLLPIVGEQVLLVRQYRPAVGEWTEELPAGMIDTDETAEDAATRELQEETGYRAERVISLGGVYPSAGSTTEVVHLFLIFCSGNPGLTDMDPSECIEQRLIPLDKFARMVENGEFLHGSGVVAWARAQRIIGRVLDEAQYDD